MSFMKTFVIFAMVLMTSQTTLADAPPAGASALKSVKSITELGAAFLKSTETTAAALVTTCKSSMGNAIVCGMAVVTIAQAVGANKQNKQSKATYDALKSNYGYSNGTGSSIDGTNGQCPGCATSATMDGSSAGSSGSGNASNNLYDSTMQQLDSEAAKLQAQASTLGASLSPDGKSVKLGNGATVSTASLGSSDALKAAGFSDAQIAAAQNALAEASKAGEAKGKALSMALQATSAGGGAALKARDDEFGGSRGPAADPYARARALAQARKANAVSGMSKKLGADNIGVSGDDLFEMLHRRYKARDDANNFLKQ